MRGLFTAPGQEGTVTITVAVADSPNLTDSIEVSVGDCVCAFTLQVGGNPTYVGQPGDEVSYFSSSGLVPDGPYAIGTVSFSNVEEFGASVAVEIPTTVVTGPGDYPLSSIGGGLGYGGDADFYQHASPPRGTLRIVQYEPHTALVGEVIGGVVEDWEADGPELTFSATFQVYRWCGGERTGVLGGLFRGGRVGECGARGRDVEGRLREPGGGG